MPIIIDYNAAMESFIALSVPFVALLIVVFASQKIGDLFSQFKLPLISGFLAAGVIAGPFVLDFVHTDNIPQFKFLGQIALAFIGFAAGAELGAELAELGVLSCQRLVYFLMVSLITFLFSWPCSVIIL